MSDYLDQIVNTGVVHLVFAFGGRGEDEWCDVEGVFSTKKKAKNYLRNRKLSTNEQFGEKLNSIKIVPFEINKIYNELEKV
jgi:hypothetical protein